MTPWATDIGNAYLEAKTTEKVCIKAGPEFGELQGNLLIVDKALYGLRLSGKAFNQLLSECLRDLGFYPSKAESSISMRKCPTRDVYEYVATYVGDLCIIMEAPETFLKQLSSAPYNFKLKGSGELSLHLGCGFEEMQSPSVAEQELKIKCFIDLYGNLPLNTRYHNLFYPNSN
jgi:hypothetical protein